MFTTDFISDFMELTEHDPSPLQFRLWSAIGLVAGALERRVWAKAVGRYQTFANMYILLTAGPGVGKQVISTARELWRETIEPGTTLKAFKLAPNQMTKAALVDALAKARSVRLPKWGGTYTYHSLLVAAEEFQVLLPAYDTEYIATLNEVFNNPAYYEENRRHGPKQEISVENPQLNILGGVQPSYFVATFPEEAWTTGLARRIFMVYGAEAPWIELFRELPDLDAELKARLLSKLGHLSTLHGPMGWTPQAQQIASSWARGPQGGSPIPTHTKLKYYCNSRNMFLIKLCVISTAARGAMLIEESDVKRALVWLLEAESRMPDIFREMAGRSDTAVIDELHYMMIRLWAPRREPLPSSVIIKFLSQRVPSEKVQKIFEVALAAGIFKREGETDLWVPLPRLDHGPLE